MTIIECTEDKRGNVVSITLDDGRTRTLPVELRAPQAALDFKPLALDAEGKVSDAGPIAIEMPGTIDQKAAAASPDTNAR